jgi:exportin-7
VNHPPPATPRHCASLQDAGTYLSRNVVSLLCRITKLAWFDSEAAKAIVDEAKVFLEKGTREHYSLGLQILCTLVRRVV